MQMVFPTLRNLEALEGWRTADALIDSRRNADIQPIQPVLVDGKPIDSLGGNLELVDPLPVTRIPGVESGTSVGTPPKS